MGKKIGGERPAFEELGIKQISEKVGGIRTRQHVNPLKKELQVEVEAPVWSDAYAHPERPLHVDLGCGPGRFILLKARREPERNFLGLDIRAKLVDRSNLWSDEVGVQSNVHFHFANATIALSSLLANYPGQVDCVSIQYPDPHFKKRHHKRRIVQAELVEALAALLPTGATVFLQSDVLEVAEAMRDQFERHGSSHFRVTEAHGAAAAAAATEAMVGEDGWASQWAARGWLQENPMGVPTEREVYVTDGDLPVYRVLLERF